MGEPAQYAPGQQLPGTVYRVVRHLATGGMGSVYDVEDVTVGKRYVLKTLHPQLVSRHDLARRMEAEARALAKLQHPNIVDVVTAGMTSDDSRMPFYVMERLNGQNLRVVIEKKGSLELTHCYRIAIDVLDALEHAHENSVIHRDVKPENIFLHRNPNGTTITKLLDFGIMRLLDRKMSHTQGKFIGTLRYASPEQIFGGDLGPSTDIYSLGIVLYEMLAGRGPFDEIGDAYAIGAAHAQRPPPPLSQFVHVPVPLERLVMSALAKSPHERPRDCFSFARDLRLLLRDEEAAPKSATAINVLSSAPNTRAALPLAGTESSSQPPPGPPPAAYGAPAPPPAVAYGAPAPLPAIAYGGATDIGMMPPSNLVDPQAPGVLPPTVRQGVSGGGASADPSGGQGAPRGSTELGVAATLVSHAGGESGRAIAAAARAGSMPAIDRAAETRASGVSGATQRFAQNGTAIDDGAGGLLPDDDVRAALAQRYPLEVPPASGHPDDARRGELVFPQNHGYASGTGPLAGEARTRPPERSMLLPLLGAAAFGALLVGGAVLLVLKPWSRHAASGDNPPVMTASAEAPRAPSSAPPAPAATATATGATTITVMPVAPVLAPGGTAIAAGKSPSVVPAPPRTTTPRTSGSPAATAALPAPPASPALPAPASHKAAPKPASSVLSPSEIKFE